MRVALVFLLLLGHGFAITQEVLQVFVPASYHDTDSVNEYGVKGELVQAAVLDRTVVVSGAFPEDLARIILLPFQIPANNPAYQVQEANLAILCGLELEVNYEGNLLDVVFDCRNFKIPENIELTGRQVLTMTIEALRRTLRIYYQGDYQDPFQCNVNLRDLPKTFTELKDLKTTFRIGEKVKDSKSEE